MAIINRVTKSIAAVTIHGNFGKDHFPLTAFAIIRGFCRTQFPAESCHNSRLYPKTCETTNDTSLVVSKTGSKHGKRNAKMSSDPQGLRLPKQGSPRFALTSLSIVQCVV